jgi:Protein of unknown function (DUF3024)
MDYPSLARLRHGAVGWRLYWPDRNSRWHLVADVPAATSLGPMLEAVDTRSARSADSFLILLIPYHPRPD